MPLSNEVSHLKNVLNWGCNKFSSDKILYISLAMYAMIYAHALSSFLGDEQTN